jgi:uncharacterized SAM-binding protein YcdF (DUF218 family)
VGLLEIGRHIWHTFEPEALAVSVPVLGAVLLWTRLRGFARWLLTGYAFFLVALVLLPVPQWLGRQLEDRYPALGAMPPGIEAIVVLAGDEPDGVAAWRGGLALGESGERVVALAALALRYPDLPVAFSGARRPVAVFETLRAFGLPPDRILTDIAAQRTADSALNLRPLLAPARRILLVTSAMHMPRSMATFRAAGWQPVAWPVDFRTGLVTVPAGLPARFTHQLALLGDALHEWIGLVAYRVAGRTDVLLP